MKYKVKKPIQPRPGIVLKPGDEIDRNALGGKKEVFERTGAIEPIRQPPKKVETAKAQEEKTKHKSRRRKKAVKDDGSGDK